MTNIQIGAQMYSLRDHCQEPGDMLATMKALKAMGYNIVQLSGYNTAIPAQQLKDMLDESGLKCVCTHTSFDLTLAIGSCCLIGFPGTFIVSDEVARTYGDTEEEHKFIESRIMPQMLVSGFTTVTIASVFLAGFLVNFL